MNFENELINDIHISRYLASWLNAGGVIKEKAVLDTDVRVDRHPTFRKWLKSLVINGRHLTDDEVRHIVNFSTCGKLELEDHARNFMETQ